MKFRFPPDQRPCPRGTSKPFNSKKLGHIDLDATRLEPDLGTIDEMRGNDAYGPYNVTINPRYPGEWGQVIFGNKSGDANVGLSVDYAGHFEWTIEGQKVPYIQELVETVFRVDVVKSVRLFRAANAIVAAHVDYLEPELPRGFQRIHIPLRSSPQSLNTEGAFAYHMAPGDVFFLNARAPHAGGNLGTGASRVHLIIDADADVPLEDVFRLPEAVLTGGEPEFIQRNNLNQAEMDKLIDGLAAVMTAANYPMCAGLANTLPFTHEFDTGAVYDVLIDAAVRSGNADLVETAQADRSYFLGVD